MTKRPRLEEKPMIEACGPVQISKAEELYIGATRVTDNTARDAVLADELVSCVERGTLHADDGVLITVDSLFVKGLIDEKFTARARHVAVPHVESDKTKATTPRFAGYAVTRAMWEMALQIAWQMRVHARSFSIDGGDGAH